MPKEKMLCPFSKKLCRECPLYRGRHYYLCYSSKYRGHLKNYPGGIKPELAKAYFNKFENFKIPPVLKRSPTWLVLEEFEEKKKNRGEK
jgi:hypothetical protein